MKNKTKIDKKDLIVIAKTLFDDGYYFHEQKDRWYFFDKCLKHARKISSSDIMSKVIIVIDELELIKRDIFDIQFLADADMKVIKDKIKSLSANIDFNNYWRFSDSNKTVIVFNNVELELETQTIKVANKFQYLLPWESQLAVEYRPELGTSPVDN